MKTRKIFVIVYKRHICLSAISAAVLALLLLFAYSIYNSEKKIDAYLSDKDFSEAENHVRTVGANVQDPKLAIIIDDFGKNRKGVSEMMSIKRPLTFAVMPFLDYSGQDAVSAHDKGFEIILHLPMQSEKDDIQSWLGPRPVKLNLSASQIKKITADSINSIPYIAGVNIHMGALASENERVISAVMETVSEKGLYFVDSLTSARTVCRKAAKKTGINFIERDVFLEGNSNNVTKNYVKSQLSKAGEIALKYGYAVAIGHVGSAGGRVTAEAINEMIPVLEKKGIEFVYVSELFKQHN